MISSTGVAIAGATADSRARSPRAGPSGTAAKDGNESRGKGPGQKFRGQGQTCGCLSRRPAAILHSQKRPLIPPVSLSVCLGCLWAALSAGGRVSETSGGVRRLSLTGSHFSSNSRRARARKAVIIIIITTYLTETTNGIRTALICFIFLWGTIIFPKGKKSRRRRRRPSSRRLLAAYAWGM